jgi:7,8-dihydropterin-6-yl-methyl-4-(beta-D-ribofuranosyl)aminobenzene 5'-phosphate synthase
VLSLSQHGIAKTAEAQTMRGPVRHRIVFNNVPFAPGLETGWGFSCVIDGLDKTILFDTGGNGDVLLSNMLHLGIDPRTIDVIVLSHIHAEHTGGISTFLARNHAVTVYIPQSFPKSFQGKVALRGSH